MSWPSIWQNQNQAPTNQADMGTGNLFMSPEQYALQQQQTWQQWQIYQAQMTQWQAQCGDQMNSQAMVPNFLMQNMYPGAIPPLPVENKPPPPPPPSASTTTTSVSDPNAGQSIQAGILQQQQQQQQSLLTANNQAPAIETIQSHMPSIVNNVDQPESAKPSTQESFEPHVNRFNDNNRHNIKQDNDDNSYPNWRNNNSRNDRNWTHNNWNQPRNQNPFANDSHTSYRSANFENENRDESKFQTSRQNLADVKSQEEIEFDEQYRIWEEQFDQWKRDNENHQDGQRYNDFLKQMENCRNKMLQKREMLRKKRLKSFGISDSPPPQQHSKKENSFKREMDNSKPLFASNDSGGIPGLDLVHGGNSTKHEIVDTKLEGQSAPIADINQILDDPNIKSLLSNIHMQQQQQKQQQQQQHQNEMNQFNEKRNDRFQANKMNSFEQSSGSSAESLGKRNPFRNKNIDNFAENSVENQRFDNNDFDERPIKRECRWNDGGDQQFNRFQQEDRNVPRERMQSHSQSFDAQSFRNNRKRPRNDDQSYFDESARNLNEFRPVQVFDYQNQRKNPPQQLPTFVQQPAFAGSRLLQLQSDLHFPRRTIDYNHKSKKFNFKEFCPIIQMEYNHKSKPFSLHEHPPIKRPIKNEIKKEVKAEPYNQSYGPRGGEFMQLRQPKWENQNKPKPWQQQPLPQQQRYPYSNQAPHQQRYEDERFDYRYNNNNPSNDYQYQRSMDNQSYYNNRNQPERHWQSRDFDDTYNRDRRPQHAASTSTAPYIKTESTSFIKTEPPAIKMNEHQRKDINDLIFPPGRRTRPAKLAILLRGPPGAGKSFVAKAIKEKECEMNGSVRILSIDDYFITENDDGKSNGRMIYEYDAAMEDKYMQCLAKLFRKTLIDRLFDVIIVDCNNITLEYLNDFYLSACVHQYTPYVCEMPLDEEKCLKNNIHNRTASDIKKAITSWVPTPTSYTLLNYESLFNDADATEAISDNDDEPSVSDAAVLDAISDEDGGQMSGQHFDDDDDDDGNSFNEFGCFKSKWDNDSTENKLARLDGINKRMKHASIEEYLQMDGWEPPPSSSNGKKRVRWADIEEKREQDKQRAIGFVVGQTNWDNLLDQPRDRRDGGTALTKIKYIEKVNKR